MMFSMIMCDFFFFKQKTAYEMRISDWSSDVCSSDLPGAHHQPEEYDARHSRKCREQVKIDITEHFDERARRGARQEAPNDARLPGDQAILRGSKSQLAQGGEISDHSDSTHSARELFKTDRACHAPTAVAGPRKQCEADIGHRQQNQTDQQD